MKTSLRGLAEIASHEGIVLEPYVDSVGVWTIGIGHTAAAGSPDPSAMPKGKAITLERAFQLFEKDIKTYEAAVSRAIKVPVSQYQFDAAVSFHYNTGSIAKASWVKALNAGDAAKAAEQIMNWGKPPEIIPRRRKEQALFRDGIYGDGMATIFPADDRGRVQWAKGTRINVLERLGASPRQPDDPGVAESPSGAPRGLLAI
ncbi:MAG TPA: lysozyme, partial [Burkholderiaceae bacterium]|nr:lysozyme [Burkholderiaceae bacterium]